MASRNGFGETHSVSRRKFIKLATGMLVTLPSIAGGYIVPAKIAYGDTESATGKDGGDSLETITKITMVSPYELGIVVADAATSGTKRIPDAKVVITSRSTKEKLEGTSNSDGEVLFDIRNLAENPDSKDVDDLDSYEFNGSLEVYADGYREFATALMRFEGGNGMMAPTHSLEEKMPYPRQAAIDDWDILYGKNAFLTSPKNTDSHKVLFEFKQLGSDKVSVSLKMKKDGTTLLSKEDTPKNGDLTVTFEGKYLQKGASGAFPITGTQDDTEDDAKYEAFCLEAKQGNNVYTWDLHLMVCEGVIEEPAEQPDSNLKPLNTSLTSKTGLDLTWPADLPIVGGGNIKTFMPDLPYNLSFNPWGYLQFTAKTPQYGYKTDNGKGDDPKGWGKYPQKSASDQMQKQFDKATKAAEKASASSDKDGLIKPTGFTANFQVLVNAQLIVVAKWSTKEFFFEGLVGGQLFITLNTALTWDFWVGYIPFTATVAFDMTAIAGLTGAMYTDKNKNTTALEQATNMDGWHFDYSNTGLTLTFNVIPSFSFGVGVSGLASFSARIRYVLTMVFGYSFCKTNDLQGTKPGHVKIGYAADVSFVLSFFLFTTTIPLYQWKYRDYYDNWKGGKQEDGDAIKASADEGGMMELINQMSIIKSHMLEATKEFNGARAVTAQSEQSESLTAMGEQEEAQTNSDFNWEDVRLPDIQAPLDDGRVITYRVYSLKVDRTAEGLAAQESAAEESTSTTDEPTSAAPSSDTTQADSTAGDSSTNDVATSDMETTPTAEAPDGAPTSATSTSETASSATSASTVSATETAPAVEPSSQTSASAQDATLAATDAGLVVVAAASDSTGGEGTDEVAAAEAEATETEAAEAEASEVASEAAQDTPSDDTSNNSTNQDENTQTTDESSKSEAHKSVLRRLPDEHTLQSTRGGEQSGEGGLFAMADTGGSILMDPGVASLGTYGGIRPSSDKMIAENVFGDPRIKIVDMHTDTNGVHLRATCSFRIGSVAIDGEMRTRIIMTVIDAESNLSDASKIGSSKPLDFPIDIDDDDETTHADLFDYDFDLAFTSVGDADTVHLVVLSGSRAKGDDTEFTAVATDTVVSYVNFHVYEAFGGRVNYMVRSVHAKSIMGKEDGKCHAIGNMKCATDGTEESNTILIAYLDGAADTPEGLFEGKYGISNTHVGFAIVKQDEENWIVPDRAMVDNIMGHVESDGIHRMSLSPRIGGAYTVTLSSVDETFFFVVRLDDSKGTFTSIKQAAMLSDDLRLLPWPAQDCFLTTYPKASYLEEINGNGLWKNPSEWDRSKWVLQKASWVDDVDGTPVLSCTEIGPDNFNIQNFGINNSGTFIFWPQTRMGGDERRIYDDEGNYETIPDDDLYQLMACRVYNGIFSEPFIAADLPHDLSSIEIVASRDNTAPLEVLSVEPVVGTETGNNGQPMDTSVNIWYTAIPHVKCATAIGCLAPVPFVAPGGDLTFYVTIRNDGNSYLSGCTVQMYEHDSKTDETATEVSGSTAQMTFSAETIIESHYNPIVDGEMQNVEADFALAPGKTSIYKTKVPIPKDWKGEKFVSFVASSPVVAEGGGLTGMSEDGIVYQEFSIGPGEYRPMRENITSYSEIDNRNMATIQMSEPAADGSDLADSPLTYTVLGGNASDGGSGSSGGNVRKVLPDTGDAISGTLAAGVAAAGAALAAYGKRRAENEK